MATINDIAKMAGVSAATVSHVVNNTRYVSPELRERVERAIEEAPITPNFVIRKRKNKHPAGKNLSSYVLFLVSDIQNSFTLELEKYLRAMLAEHEYLLVTLDVSGKGKIALLEQLLIDGEALAGVIASMEVYGGAEVEFLKQFSVPKVVIGNQVEGVSCDRVFSSNLEGAYKATVHLIRSGHEHIALLCGNSASESNLERIAGYKKALSDNGIQLKDEFVVTDLQTEEETERALHVLLHTKQPPSAVFVANHRTVLSVLRYISKNSIECPKDISVVGFNDFSWAPLVLPPVTVVRQNTKELASSALGLLFSHIEEQKDGTWATELADPQQIEVATELRVRGSTCGIGRGPFGEKAANIGELQLSEDDIKACKKGNFTAAISFHYSGKSWMLLHEQGIRNVFDQLNISLIAMTDAHFNPELQNKQLKSIMMLEPDVLISIPTDNEKTAQTYREIAESGTKLVFISNVPEGLTREDYAACVSVNERSHGRFIGHGLGEYMRNMKKTKIGILKHGANFYTTNQRDLAGEQILSEEYPELQICAVESFLNEEDAYDATIRMMNKNSEIEGIYVSWEGPAQSVMSALTDISRTDVAISTGDLEFNIAMSMAKGGMIKAVSAQCPYEQGQALALSAANVLIGKSIPSYIGMEPIYVEKENLLKAWQKVYKESAPEQLEEILH